MAAATPELSYVLPYEAIQAHFAGTEIRKEEYDLSHLETIIYLCDNDMFMLATNCGTRLRQVY